MMKRAEIRGANGALPLRDGDEVGRDLAMLVEGETSGRPLEEILEEFGRSRSTYYEKLKRFREKGVVGLFPNPPGPRGPWKRTAEVERQIVIAKLRDPTVTAARIAIELAARGASVSESSVERTLQLFGLGRVSY